MRFPSAARLYEPLDADATLGSGRSTVHAFCNEIFGMPAIPRRRIRLPEARNCCIGAVRYADETLGLNERVACFRATTRGVDALEEFVDFWGNDMPDIHGLAKALLVSRDTDEAAAAAWDDRMGAARVAPAPLMFREIINP